MRKTENYRCIYLDSKSVVLIFPRAINQYNISVFILFGKMVLIDFDTFETELIFFNHVRFFQKPN